MFGFVVLIVAGAVALAWLSRFQRDLSELRKRVAALEAAQGPWGRVETASADDGAGDAAVPPAGAPPVPPEPVAQSASPASEYVPPGVPEPEPVMADAAQDVPVAQAPAEAPRSHGLEERFGTRWVVWVGGLALALGGIFLVQYSIEQGLLGPGPRIALGALLAVVLIAAGEWLRRRELPANVAMMATAHIPSILTAAGTVVAYATVYAAYALYGFLDGGVAFILLGVVALATLVASLLHGPAVAAMGVVGAFVAPLLVSSVAPNYWALVLYLAVVTAAALALARARLWRWLAVTALVLSVLWVVPFLVQTEPAALVPFGLHVLVGFALASMLVVSGLLFGPDPVPGRVEFISSGALAVYGLAAALLVVSSGHDAFLLIVFAVTAAATVWVASRSDAAAGAVPAAAVLASLVIVDWAVQGPLASGVLRGGPGDAYVIPEMLVDNRVHIAVGAVFAALFGASGFLRQGASVRALPSLLWAASAVYAPVAILVALYYRLTGFERSIPFALGAMALAGLFAVATDWLGRRSPAPGLASAAAIFATGAVAGLALALTFALEKGWLSVAFALMAAGVAWVAGRRPLPALRWLVAALVVLVVLRIAYEQQLVAGDFGTTPIFNWLLYSYGGPAVAFWLAGWLLRRRADDVPTRMTESAAILFTVLLFFLEIRHWMNDGVVYGRGTGLSEAALQISTGLALAIGLERIRAVSSSIVHDIGALVVAGLCLLGIVIWLLIDANPWFSRVDVGGTVLNLLLLAYLLPALLVFVLVRVTRNTRPLSYRWIGDATAVVLFLAYLTLEVTRLFHGPIFAWPQVGDAEQYTYSAVWLAYGVALLTAGILLRSGTVRLASAAVVAITVAKVFLIDLGGLTGIYRALSFIGLGLVLVGIGWLYQRLLFPAQAPPRAAPSGGASQTTVADR